MSPKRRVTIREVAKTAGVSIQTVSRVINNRPDVASETYQRVQRVIQETGFAPNSLARSLIKGRSNTLGVVAYGLDYFGPSRLLTGIEQQAVKMGYSIVLNLLPRPETRDVEGLLASLFARQVDGIIWAIPEIGGNRAWARAQSLDLSIPIVFVGGMDNPTSQPLAGIDNRAIGRMATMHLLEGGSRVIGLIGGPPSWWEARERQRGWREALESYGLAPDDRLVAVGDWSAESGEHGLYQLLVQCPELEAVFASNDQMALGVLHVAHRLGRRVPDDLSVIGVDNIPEAAHFCPPLTSMRQRLRDAGALVVRELDRTIQKTARGPRPAHSETELHRGVGRGEPRPARGPASPPVNLLQPELIVRESTCPIVGIEAETFELA